MKCLKTFCLMATACIAFNATFAHNGKVAYAYPLGNITIDGNFSDWPAQFAKYPIAMFLSDVKPKDESDFSGFFKVGYRLENRSLYLAFTVTDDDFMEDTSANVRWNTQDGLELSIDARHLPSGSGVASFMYSKKLRNINNAFFDPFAKDASWKIMEVAMERKGSVRYYEWRIMLGDHFAVNKSVGLDFHVFDLDKDSSFSFTGWGSGGFKYRIPSSLGDVVLLPENKKLGTVTGNIAWEKSNGLRLPGTVQVKDTRDPKFWLTAQVDSTGNYSLELPTGQYQVQLPERYYQSGNQLYLAAHKKPVTIVTKPGVKMNATKLLVAGGPAPDLIPAKGVLHNFSSASAATIDKFIESYQKYYRIPGVSLALIKDGKVVYHKTYGVRNTMTGAKVDENTLFEAASITKPVFAFAVQRLAEKGVIDMDKPMYEYLPYPDIAYDDRYKLMTAKHVLTHRTGFPNWRWMNQDARLDLKFTPGTDFNYSGEGFEYLKMVVEKITGKKVEQVLREEILEPAGLYHTFFSKNDSLKRMVAQGHYDEIPSNKDLPENPGMAYSMHTEAKAFTKFMLYLLEQKGLTPETYETMLSKHSEYKYDPGDEKPQYPTYMGMSLEIRETPWGKSFGHGGNNGDFKCKFEVYKDLKMGYAIYTNSNTSDQLLSVIRDFLVEGKDKLPLKQ